MTPIEWYNQKRTEYKERYGTPWQHLSMFEPNQNSEVCETAMRSGIECRALQANGADEVEMIANSIMIRDYIKSCRNSAKEIA